MQRRLASEVMAEMEEAAGRLDVTELPEGFGVEIETQNSVYRIDRACTITNEAGHSGSFAGCTLGGSMLSINRVFIGGLAEFTLDGRTWHSSPIKRVDAVLDPEPTPTSEGAPDA